MSAPHTCVNRMFGTFVAGECPLPRCQCAVVTMADRLSGLQAEVGKLSQQVEALKKTIVVEKLGQQLDALQTTMDEARATIYELRKEYGINKEVEVSDTECDDLVGWEMPGALIADQTELKVDEKKERAAAMKRLISLAPKVKACAHAAQMVTLFGNQHGRGIKCTKCGLKVFEKNYKGGAKAMIVVTMP